MHNITRIDDTFVPRVIWIENDLHSMISRLSNLAHSKGYVWKAVRNMLFGGYWVNPSNGDGYMIDYPSQ